MSRFALVGPIHPLRGGIAQHSAGIIREARSRGHAARVFSYRRQYPERLFPGRTQLDPDPAPPEATHETSAPIDSLSPISWVRTGRQVARFAPDAVLLQRWHPFFAPALATIAAGTRGRSRVVWLVHNARPHEGRIPWGPLLRLGLRRTDVCLVHAEVEEAELRGLGVRAGIRRVPMPALTDVCGVDSREARDRLGFAADEVVFLFFGHVRPYKGVDVLLEALTRLAADGPRWRAVIAGEWYVDRGPAEALVARAGLSDRVRIEDRFLTQAEMAEYIAASTVVVLPYRSGTQSAVVPLAHAYGRPVVTTRVGGLPEIVSEGETGLLVPPSDVPALGRALEEVRRGHAFDAAAIARAHARASFGPLVDALEAIVRPPLFP